MVLGLIVAAFGLLVWRMVCWFCGFVVSASFWFAGIWFDFLTL